MGVSCAAACGSDGKPPGIASENTSGSSGSRPRSGGSNGDAGVQDSPAGGGADAGLGGAGSAPIGEIGGEGVYAVGGAPPDVPPTCDREMAAWPSLSVTGISTPGADERLLAMTHDELTLVFSREDALFVSDRTSPSAAFEAPAEITLPEGYAAARGMTLGPDGKSLVLARNDGTAFVELTRALRSGSFDGVPSSGRFEAINDARGYTGDLLSSPALSADGTSLYYTAQKGETLADVWRAGGDALRESQRLDHASLGTDDGKAKLVVSVSADERTLFVYDEARGFVAGLWSITPRSALTQAIDFEGVESVFVNGACDHWYGTVSVEGSLDVVVAAPK